MVLLAAALASACGSSSNESIDAALDDAGPDDLTELVFDPQRLLRIEISIDESAWNELRHQHQDVNVLVAEDWAPRMICSSVGLMATDLTVRAEVHLRAGEIEARGTCEGPNQGDSDLTLVARAALEAVGMLLAEPLILGLNEIRVRNLGGQSVVMTAVDLVEGRRSETLFGTCSAGHNRSQAVVHSVLDAVNRRLTLYALKAEEFGA